MYESRVMYRDASETCCCYRFFHFREYFFRYFSYVDVDFLSCWASRNRKNSLFRLSSFSVKLDALSGCVFCYFVVIISTVEYYTRPYVDITVFASSTIPENKHSTIIDTPFERDRKKIEKKLLLLMLRFPFLKFPFVESMMERKWTANECHSIDSLMICIECKKAEKHNKFKHLIGGNLRTRKKRLTEELCVQMTMVSKGKGENLCSAWFWFRFVLRFHFAHHFTLFHCELKQRHSCIRPR